MEQQHLLLKAFVYPNYLGGSYSNTDSEMVIVSQPISYRIALRDGQVWLRFMGEFGTVHGLISFIESYRLIVVK